VNAYQETPGPDGITVFVMLLGYFTNWTNVTGSLSWPKGTRINSILDTLAGLLQLSLRSTLPDTLESQVSYSFTGLVSAFVSDLVSAIDGIQVYPDGPFLVAYKTAESTGLRHVIRFLITPPKHEAFGYNLVAPWDPTIRPGGVLVIDTRYVRQTYGGAQVGNSQTLFVAQTVSFDFSTTDETNSMSILATAAAQ